MPYAITEEFVAVYRVHPLLPDDLTFRSVADDRLLLETTFQEVAFQNARPALEKVGLVDALYSFGIQHPGAITLHNFPKALQRLTDMDGMVNDLGAIDLLRGRERGVPRYNDFRFGFSDTAFRIFILMASRRLKSDRFFTTDFTPHVYTQTGMSWIADNTFSTILRRHAPALGPALSCVKNAFAPWPNAGQI